MGENVLHEDPKHSKTRHKVKRFFCWKGSVSEIPGTNSTQEASFFFSLNISQILFRCCFISWFFCSFYWGTKNNLFEQTVLKKTIFVPFLCFVLRASWWSWFSFFCPEKKIQKKEKKNSYEITIRLAVHRDPSISVYHGALFLLMIFSFLFFGFHQQ